MPLFPQGGGLYPDSIDNSILADMADGTLKGRALGAGVGNPQDLTVAQIWALLGNPVFTNCRLDYVSTTVIRLNRCNGLLLTIDNLPRTIPAAGVDLAVTGLTVGTGYYIYAFMNAGVMTLEPSASGYLIDARNGLPVKSSDVTRTLVGWARCGTSTQWYESQFARWVASYWNRRPKWLNENVNVVTASTSYVVVGNPLNVFVWADETLRMGMSGYVVSNTQSTANPTDFRVNGVSQNINAMGHAPIASGAVPIGCFGVIKPGENTYLLQAYGAASSGQGTWTGTCWAETNS